MKMSQNQKIISLILLSIINISLVIQVVFSAKNTTLKITPPKNWETFDEVSDYFKKIAQSEGAEYAFQELATATLPPNVDMHLLGHTIGNVLYEKEGVDGIKKCTHDVRNACSHAIVVGEFLKEGENAFETISQACKNAPGGLGAYTMCFHGLGHGVLAFTSYDYEDAVSLCQKVGTAEYSHREAKECIGGMTMEMLSGFHNPEAWEKQKSRFLKITDPLSPCNSSYIPKDHQFFCYLYLTPYFFELTFGNLSLVEPTGFSKSMEYCQLIPDSQPENKDACFGGFGKEFVVLAKNRDVRLSHESGREEIATIIKWCTLTPKEANQQSCLKYALNSLYWGGENDISDAIIFCQESPINHQKWCINELVGGVKYYAKSQEEFNQACQKLPTEWRVECNEN